MAVIKTKEVSMQSVQKQVSMELLGMEMKIRNSFGVIKEEFEDHLDAINENTEELQSQYGSLCELNRKIEKLNERVDQMSAMVKELVSERSSINLTLDEQRVFLVLYTHDEGFLSFDEVVERTHFNADYCRDMITSMLDKGIRLTREVTEGKLHFKLNPYFKARQIRENIVKIDPSVLRQMENKVLGSYF
ncbi:MAG TPA: hypothetical protein VJC00_03220 [Candidatus Nanoarchaeia archaeon]|nr:hypothetical protein [Candidatus Nanoarchaeia archaeon]